MTAQKTSLKEIFSDDPNSPFWQRLRASPGYTKFEQDLAEIMTASIEHGVPYNQITRKEK